jgi:hypothetical protein
MKGGLTGRDKKMRLDVVNSLLAGAVRKIG